MAFDNVVLLSNNLPSAYMKPRRTRDLETQEDIIDLEFSEYGRDPRFLPGWWILPGMLLGTALTAWAAATL